MTTEKPLTTQEIYGGNILPVTFPRAIEQAVLKSPEVQAWKKDAERYRWLLEACYRWPANGGLCNEIDQSEPVALWVKRKVGDDPCAAIDAAMENQT